MLPHYISKKEFYQLNNPEEDESLLKEIIIWIKTHTEIQEAKPALYPQIISVLRHFNILKGYKSVGLLRVFLLDTENPYYFLVLSIASVQERITQHRFLIRETIEEQEFAGLIKLKHSFPHTYIRPETLTDKLKEFFSPTEVDFKEDKEFSKKYFVQTENEALLRKKISQNFLAAIKRYDNLEVEIIEHWAFVRIRRRLSRQTAGTIINLLAKLAQA